MLFAQESHRVLPTPKMIRSRKRAGSAAPYLGAIQMAYFPTFLIPAWSLLVQAVLPITSSKPFVLRNREF